MGKNNNKKEKNQDVIGFSSNYIQRRTIIKLPKLWTVTLRRRQCVGLAVRGMLEMWCSGSVVGVQENGEVWRKGTVEWRER